MNRPRKNAAKLLSEIVNAAINKANEIEMDEEWNISDARYGSCPWGDSRKTG